MCFTWTYPEVCQTRQLSCEQQQRCSVHRVDTMRISFVQEKESKLAKILSREFHCLLPCNWGSIEDTGSCWVWIFHVFSCPWLYPDVPYTCHTFPRCSEHLQDTSIGCEKSMVSFDFSQAVATKYGDGLQARLAWKPRAFRLLRKREHCRRRVG